MEKRGPPKHEESSTQQLQWIYPASENRFRKRENGDEHGSILIVGILPTPFLLPTASMELVSPPTPQLISVPEVGRRRRWRRRRGGEGDEGLIRGRGDEGGATRSFISGRRGYKDDEGWTTGLDDEGWTARTTRAGRQGWTTRAGRRGRRGLDDGAG